MPMSKSKKIEIVQNIAIVLLLLSAGLLTVRLWFFNQQGNALGQEFLSRLFGDRTEAETSIPAGRELREELLCPRDILVKNKTDVKSFAGTEELSQAYRELEEYLVAAFSSADAFEKADLTWETVVAGGGILLDYGADYPFQLGARLADHPFDKMGGVIFRYLYLTLQEGTINFYLEDLQGGGIYRAVLEDGELAEGYRPLFNTLYSADGTFQTTLYCDFGGEAGIQPLNKCGAPPFIGALTVQNPIYDQASDSFSPQPLNSILKVFQLNPSPLNAYPEKDGTLVYVENVSNARISRAGVLEYTANSTANGISIETFVGEGDYQAADMVLAALGLIRSFDQSTAGGAARLYFQSVAFDAKTRRYTVNFDYYYNGIRLESDGPAATVVLSSGRIVEAKILFQNVQKVSQEGRLADFEQAARILLSKRGQGAPAVSLEPVYRLSEEQSARLLPVWVGYVEGGGDQ